MNTLDVELKIKELVEHGERYVFDTSKELKDFEWSVDNIINEIQLYRGLGTVEEFKELKEKLEEQRTTIKTFNYGNTCTPVACSGCSNHPTNGGSGICHCTLGQSQIT